MALKRRPPLIRVGILGAKPREDGGPTNAQVGAAHEFGTTKLPVRSFLRVPLAEHLGEYLEAAGAVSPEAFAQIIAAGSFVPWAKKVGIVAENVVADAFDTGGFGKWPPSDMTHKKVARTLVETAQLRNSITSEVKE